MARKVFLELIYCQAGDKLSPDTKGPLHLVKTDNRRMSYIRVNGIFVKRDIFKTIL
jgi:hypothetical protein